MSKKKNLKLITQIETNSDSTIFRVPVVRKGEGIQSLVFIRFYK